MINIAYDISSLNQRQISGIGVYTLSLLQALRERTDVQLRPFWRTSRWKHRKIFHEHVGLTRPWFGGLGLSADVVHGPDFRVVKTRRAARVVTIHDLAFLQEGMTSAEFAERKKRDLDKLLSPPLPDAIITISEATNRELIRYRPDVEDRTSVVYLGADHFVRPVATAAETFGNYFLFVGNLEARKNVLGILKSFEIYAATVPKTRLVLVGKPGYQGEEILAALQNSPQRERIDLIGYCTQEELLSYYHRALALVYPSWIEGFGLPVIEAMQLGCPVITSSTTSTGEIAGQAAWLVDPADNGAIAQAMREAQSLADQPEARLAWISRAQTQASSFTWKRCAAETVAAYQRALTRRLAAGK